MERLPIYSYKSWFEFSSQTPSKAWRAMRDYFGGSVSSKITSVIKVDEETFTIGFRYDPERKELVTFEVDGFIKLPQSIPWGKRGLFPNTPFHGLEIELYTKTPVKRPVPVKTISQIDYVKVLHFLEEKQLVGLRPNDEFFSTTKLEFTLKIDGDRLSADQGWLSADCLGASIHLALTQKVLDLLKV